ncbi:MAG TPA: 16S rRNA (cytidine(1402)-2'-O)-methyltransferase [Thermoanaerobaculia bacterium]|nr:16S rRNA (cytidine(1402)-2'-O)-methyltransferase [Thermoanaerobaculia bacterium]
MAQRSNGRLLLVGTPIGNLEDLSPRARRALKEANLLLCEDTRVTGKLAARFGLTAERISCPAPREKSRVAEVLRRLEAGQTVALVSDAGMPGLSDPGEHLVAAAAGAGFPVLVVPGPSAPAAALAVSGLPAVPHLFLGFLPARAGERRRLLQSLKDRPETLVWFEAPHRLSDSLEDAAQVLGPRRCAVARELTKLHEETVRGTLEDVARVFRSRGAARGEATVVTQGHRRPVRDAAADFEEIDREIQRELALGKDKRSIARAIGSRLGRPAREIYARAVALSRRETENGKRETKSS